MSARAWEAAGGWSCACSASLSRAPRGCTGAATRPQAQPSESHMPIPARPWSAPHPAGPRWGSKGSCVLGMLVGSGAHLAAWHPRTSWGTAFKFSLPELYYNAAACPYKGSTIPVNFPADFPASPSPASGCNYCAWQLLPSATAPCRVYYSSPPLPRDCESCGSARRSHPARPLHSRGLGATEQLRGHWAAREWPWRG